MLTIDGKKGGDVGRKVKIGRKKQRAFLETSDTARQGRNEHGVRSIVRTSTGSGAKTRGRSSQAI